jgi:regulator of replication initiation timing
MNTKHKNKYCKTCFLAGGNIMKEDMKKEIEELKKQINNLIGDNLALQLKIAKLVAKNG